MCDKVMGKGRGGFKETKILLVDSRTLLKLFWQEENLVLLAY